MLVLHHYRKMLLQIEDSGEESDSNGGSSEEPTQDAETDSDESLSGE